MSDMMAQWAREEEEEKQRLAALQTAAGSCSVAAAFEVATRRAGELSTDLIKAADLEALRALYRALTPHIKKWGDATETPYAATDATPLDATGEKGMSYAVPGICVPNDFSERSLYDSIVSTLVEQQTWKQADIAAYAADIIKARREFFDPKPEPVQRGEQADVQQRQQWGIPEHAAEIRRIREAYFYPSPEPKQTSFLRYDPRTGREMRQPVRAQEFRDYHGRVAWLYNPWTGDLRDVEDIGSDVYGHLISPNSKA